MDKNTAVEIIKNAFIHLIFEENVSIGNRVALLYFPSISIALFEEEENNPIFEQENVESLDDLILKKKFEAKPVYLNLFEKDFSVGLVINDILLEAGFTPRDKNK